MTEEVSSSFHISIIVFLSSAYLAAVLNIVMMSLSIYASWGNTVSDNISTGQNSALSAVQSAGVISGPQVYNAVLSSIDIVDKVDLYELDSSGDEVFVGEIYNCTNTELGETGIIQLMTKYTTVKFRVYVNAAPRKGGMVQVKVVEVPR